MASHAICSGDYSDNCNCPPKRDRQQHQQTDCSKRAATGPLFDRPGELVRMTWSQLDLDAGQLRYLVTQIKRTHITASFTHAAEIRRDLRQTTGPGEFVFSRERDQRKYMHGNAIHVSAPRCGIEES